MTTPTLTVPVAPRRQTRTRYESRAERIEFGDGYAQTSAPANPVRLTLQLSWRLSWAQADALLAFLAARGGAERFFYQLPTEAQPRLWLCAAWDDAVDVADWRIVSATFEEQL